MHLNEAQNEYIKQLNKKKTSTTEYYVSGKTNDDHEFIIF